MNITIKDVYANDLAIASKQQTLFLHIHTNKLLATQHKVRTINAFCSQRVYDERGERLKLKQEQDKKLNYISKFKHSGELIMHTFEAPTI